jgi:hypothetical protein
MAPQTQLLLKSRAAGVENRAPDRPTRAQEAPATESETETETAPVDPSGARSAGRMRRIRLRLDPLPSIKVECKLPSAYHSRNQFARSGPVSEARRDASPSSSRRRRPSPANGVEDHAGRAVECPPDEWPDTETVTAGRYLEGVVLGLLCVGALGLGACRLRSRVAPFYVGIVARIADSVTFIGLLILTLETVGVIGVLDRVGVLAGCLTVGAGAWIIGSRGRGGPTTAASPAVVDAARTSQDAGPHRRIVTALAIAALSVAAAAWLGWTIYAYRDGMATIDTLWYHLPFAARFVQLHNIRHLQYVDDGAITVFYPANSELVHAFGMILFGNDLVSPLIDLGWAVLAGCSAWAVGRPWRREPHCLLGLLVVLATPAMVDTQPGGAYDDIVCLALVLAMVALVVNAPSDVRGPGLPLGASRVRTGDDGRPGPGSPPTPRGDLGRRHGAPRRLLVPPRRHRRRQPAALSLASRAADAAVSPHHTDLHRLAIPRRAPHLDRGLHPRTAPDPRSRLVGATPGLDGRRARRAAAARRTANRPHRRTGGSARLRLSHHPRATRSSGRPHLLRRQRPLPDGPPRARPRDVRPAAGARASAGDPRLGCRRRARIAVHGPRPGVWRSGFPVKPFATTLHGGPALAGALLGAAGLAAGQLWLWRGPPPGAVPRLLAALRRPAIGAMALTGATVVVAAAGWVVGNAYAHDRYRDSPPAPAIYAWAQRVHQARIGVVGLVEQYPLTGADLTNHVQFIGVGEPHRGFAAAADCRQWRTAINRGHYNYVLIAPPGFAGIHQAPEVPWTVPSPAARPIVRQYVHSVEYAVVYRITGRLDPAQCPSG